MPRHVASGNAELDGAGNAKIEIIAGHGPNERSRFQVRGFSQEMPSERAVAAAGRAVACGAVFGVECFAVRLFRAFHRFPSSGFRHQIGDRRGAGELEIAHQIIAAAIFEQVCLGWHRTIGSKCLGIDEMDLAPGFRASRADVGEIRSLPAVADEHRFALERFLSAMRWAPDGFIR